jgi:hypothetical protein
MIRRPDVNVLSCDAGKGARAEGAGASRCRLDFERGTSMAVVRLPIAGLFVITTFFALSACVTRSTGCAFEVRRGATTGERLANAKAGFTQGCWASEESRSSSRPM